ncbi:MAG: glycosyltransferase family 39 protein [Devosia sp.]|nr:glycosyltransferase family 39 protein [Devosia sp.]
MTDSATPLLSVRSVRPLQAVVGVLLGLKVIFYCFAPPIGDEAYYWLWGQRPALSYLDHPPLHAWLLWGVSKLLGWNIYSLRALTWLSLAGTIWVFRAWSTRIAPDNARAWFWTALAIYLASPLMWVMGSISFHDHLLIVLCLLSGHFFLDFAEGFEAGAPRFGRLYLSALFLGLAALAKYNAALLGLGYFAFILLNRDFRPLLRHWQTYAAGAISVALQAPVIYWNLADGLASYKFHLVERWDGAASGDLVNLLITAVIDALVLSIFLVVPLLRLYRGGDAGFERRARILAAIMLAISTVTVMALASIENNVPTYWTIMGYPLALPLLAKKFRSRLGFWLHATSGTLLIALFVVNLLLVPVRNLVGWSDTTSYSNYDWDRIAAIVAAAHVRQPTAFLAATRYTSAAQLAFALRDPDVTDISERHTEFNYWFDPAAHRGEDALIVAAPFIPIDFARTQFRSVALLQNIEITRFGLPVGSYQLYLAKDYCAGTCR